MRYRKLLASDSCIPFEYEENFTDRGSKIGGSPPRGAIPRFDDQYQKYFGTLELDEVLALSFFYSFEIFGDDVDRDIILYNNRVLYPSAYIHTVIHPNELADNQSIIPAEVSCHSIRFKETTDDPKISPVPYSKIGGHPYVDNAPLVLKAFEQVQEEGYQQLIQFDTPNPNSSSFVDGFPWDPGWLHVFVRGRDDEDWEFAFIVQQ